MSEQQPGKPFGCLETDEKYAGEAQTKHDFDRLMLAGCVVFTASAILIWASASIPIVLQNPLLTNRQLASCVGLSAILTLVIGSIFVWRSGLSGLCGSIAGLVPAAVFVWLRIKGAVELPNIEDMTPPEFSAAASWAVPFGVFLPIALLWYGIFALHRRLERATPKKA